MHRNECLFRMKKYTLSGSFSYSIINIKKDFLTYNGGKLDIFLPSEDGTYKLPINEKLQITQVDRINKIFENLVNWSNSFSKTLSTSKFLYLSNCSWMAVSIFQ